MYWSDLTRILLGIKYELLALLLIMGIAVTEILHQ